MDHLDPMVLKYYWIAPEDLMGLMVLMGLKHYWIAPEDPKGLMVLMGLK